MLVRPKSVLAGTAVAAAASIVVGSVAAAAPPYNEDGLQGNVTASCFLVTDSAGEPFYDPNTVEPIDPATPSGSAWLKDQANLPAWVTGSYPYAATVSIEIGDLPANLTAGQTYAGPFASTMTLELSGDFHQALSDQFMVDQMQGQVTANADIFYASAATGWSNTYTVDDGAGGPVAIGQGNSPITLTSADDWSDLTVPSSWQGGTADVAFVGDDAFALVLEAINSAYPNGTPVTLNLWCSAEATIGQLQGDNTPPTPEPSGTWGPTSGALYPNDSGNMATFYRFASKNRVLTALYAAKNTTGWGSTALLASSVDYADALAAAPLADALDAPVLLANADGSLDSQVADYLTTRFDSVVIVSGPGVIPESTRNALNDALVQRWGNVYDGVNTFRIAGVNRYETAATLAVATLYSEGGKDDWTSGAQFILADGQNFPDAMASGPAAAAATNGVILLTAGSSGVPSFTSMFLPGHAVKFSGATLAYLPGWIPGWPTVTFDWSAIGGFNHQTITVVGGAAKAAAEAGMLGNITEPVEYDDAIVGADRYETATLVATKYFTSDPTYYTIASGEDFPDAVVGGAWAANADGPLVLTRNAALPSVTKNYLIAAADNGDKFVVFGGTGSVSREVSEDLQATFRW